MNSPRYEVRYGYGYYVVIDTRTGEVIPPDPGHYKKYKDGYLWDYAAASEANDLNKKWESYEDSIPSGS